MKGYLCIFEYLLRQVHDKNPADCNGITPLHLAAELGHTPIAETIIDHVIDRLDFTNKCIKNCTN